jgi:hypothetical protein
LSQNSVVPILFYSTTLDKTLATTCLTSPMDILGLSDPLFGIFSTYVIACSDLHIESPFRQLPTNFGLQVFRSETEFQVIPAITKQDVVQALADDAKVFKSIKGTLVSRSFPFQTNLTPQAKVVLCKILEDGYVSFDKTDEGDAGLRSCYENGWIHRALREDGPQIQIAAVLPSRLHEK